MLYAPPVAGGYRVSCNVNCHRARTAGQVIGTDFIPPLGGPVSPNILNSRKGKISWTAVGDSRGISCEVDHGDGSYARYLHFRSITVGPGQIVPQGFRLGTMGETGDANGIHLHMDIRYDKVYEAAKISLPFWDNNPRGWHIDPQAAFKYIVPEEEDLRINLKLYLVVDKDVHTGEVWLTDGMTRRHIPSPDAFNRLLEDFAIEPPEDTPEPIFWAQLATWYPEDK